ncbi:Crp/Fnr family transcriptional regulator [Roseovarius sp. D22-M7]|uniref:Crp/Fnr family transcriptional regulator n=1 Tax=Roseovarius sp. D22-M7 TaxID=3127116 RepID=UPI0030105B7E
MKTTVGPNMAALLKRNGRLVTFLPGATIYEAGGDDTNMMLIVEGRVEISSSSMDGRRSILTHLGPGDVLGELAALDGGPRSADAFAVTPVRGRVLTRDCVLRLLRETPDAALDAIAVLCQRLRETSGMYTAHMLTDGQTRLARLLLRLAEKWGEALPDGRLQLAERFSQSELGDLVGLTRESVNRIMRDWELAGLIERPGQGTILCDPASLAQAAGMTE